MSKHWKYLKYVLRHKWFVYRAGRKLGVSPIQLFFHDWQKFTPIEWFPYVETFYGDKKPPRRKDGGYDPNAVSEAFDRAWLHHQTVGGKHHWQYWVLPLDDGGVRALEMPDKYRREMVADWRGAGKAITGADDCLPWYEVNRHNMTLHESTRAWVEAEINTLQNEIDIRRTAMRALWTLVPSPPTLREKILSLAGDGNWTNRGFAAEIDLRGWSMSSAHFAHTLADLKRDGMIEATGIGQWRFSAQAVRSATREQSQEVTTSDAPSKPNPETLDAGDQS